MYFSATENINVDELERKLVNALPEYMIPSHYVRMDSIPYNRSGKLDEHKLPEPVRETKQYKEPENEKQKALCESFGKVLHLDKVSINDSFFALGGDSIKAIRVVTNLADTS